MIVDVLSLISYGLLLIFGAALSFDFAGIVRKREERLLLLALITVLLVMQALCLQAFGLELTRKLYPFITHLPIALFLVALLRVTPLRAGVSVLCAYLCCQIPHWVAEISGFLFGSQLAYSIGHILALPVVLWALERYAVKPTMRLMSLSRRLLLLLGGVPLLYYIYDYVATVYTDLLADGAQIAVQFIPCVVSTFYFLFTLVYYSEVYRRSEDQREADMVALQMQQAQRILEHCRQTVNNAALHQSEMRRRLSAIGSFLAGDEPEKALAYVRSAQSDNEHAAPPPVCLNETVNLVVSAYAQRAQSSGVAFQAVAELPKRVALPQAELCTLFVLALGNALAAAAEVPDDKRRAVRLRSVIREQVLLLELENSCVGSAALKEEAPVNGQDGQAFAYRSIDVIARRRGGSATFTAQDGSFLLKVQLPLEKQLPPAEH